jgi:hypothetical protein
MRGYLGRRRRVGKTTLADSRTSARMRADSVGHSPAGRRGSVFDLGLIEIPFVRARIPTGEWADRTAYLLLIDDGQVASPGRAPGSTEAIGRIRAATMPSERRFEQPFDGAWGRAFSVGSRMIRDDTALATYLLSIRPSHSLCAAAPGLA